MQVSRAHQTGSTVAVNDAGWVFVTRTLRSSLPPGESLIDDVILQLREQVAEQAVQPILLPQVQLELCIGEPDTQPQAGVRRLAGERDGTHFPGVHE